MSNWYVPPIDGEISYSELEEKAMNGEFHEWNFEPFDYQENGYEDVVDKLKQYKAADYLALDEKRKKAEEAGNTVEALGYKQQMDKMVEDVLAIYRSKNIFPIQYYSELGVMDEIEKCIAYKAKFDGNTVSCVSGDTEYFNGKEWRRIDEYREGDKVLQYNEDGTGDLVEPIKYIHYQSDEPFYVYNKDGCGYHVSYPSDKITGSHNVVFYDYSKDEVNLTKLSLSDIFKREHSMEYGPVGCVYEGFVSEEDVVMLNAFYSVISNKYLENKYTELRNGSVCLSDKCFLLDLKSRKVLLSFFGITEDLLSLEDSDMLSGFWVDCFPVVSCAFLSKDALKSLNNVLSVTYKGYTLDRVSDDEHTCMLRENRAMYTLEENFIVSYEKDKYCFTVPSGMLVLRRDDIVFITGNCGAGVGTGLCRWLFPNLFDTPSAHDLNKKDAESQYKKFLNDEYLRRAIKFCYSYKDGCPVPTAVEGGLRLVGSAPSNFRPMNAKAVYERFCPKGGTIFDYCCVDGATEFFNGKGWKRIDKYEEGDMVLQFNEDGTGELVEPIEYVNHESDDPFYLYTSTWLNSCLTGNHDVVYYGPDLHKESKERDSLISNIIGASSKELLDKLNSEKQVNKNYKYRKIKQSEILGKSFKYSIPVTFEGKGGNLEVNKDILKLIAYSHNNMLFRDKDKGAVSVFVDNQKYLSKLLTTLGNLGLEYAYGEYRDSKSFVVEFECKELLGYFNEEFEHIAKVKKQTSYCVLSDDFYNLSKQCSIEFANAIIDWCSGGYYTTSSLRNSMIVQYMVVSNGCAAYVNESSYGKSGILYKITFGKNNQFVTYSLSSSKKRDSYEEIQDTHKYCFVVPSHMLILRRNGRIFITGNCGFGGRMLGALTSKNNYRYVGTDPCTETMYHLHQLGEYIEMVTDREDSYELHCCGSEEFRGKPNSIDFAFSSPPYFNLEVYSDEETQCYNKFPKLEEWLEGFVRQTIRNIYYMLKPGCFYAVNIADFKVGGGGEVAYVDEWKRISAEEGMPLFDTVYLGVTARAGSAEQAAGELKKENIMIFKKPL